MAVYAVTGKLGSGKGKASIDQLRRYLRAGKRVATNCDVFLEHLMPALDKSSVIRIPDKPSAVDLYMIGSGNKFIQFETTFRYTDSSITAVPPSPNLLPGFDESHNGALILDECGSWLNTRNFQDKGRAELLEWAIHARKYGWDVFFVMQNVSQIDKQLRDSLLEYVVRLNRLDRMKVPFISAAVKVLTAGMSEGNLPRLHVGVVRLGSSPDGLVADRWVFRGDDLNAAYNTTQVFSDAYPHGTHSLLSSWHLSAFVGVPADFIGPLPASPAALALLRPRLSPSKPSWTRMIKFIVCVLCFGLAVGGLGGRYAYMHGFGVDVPQDKPIVYEKGIQGLGYFSDGSVYTVSLSDGRLMKALRFRRETVGWSAMIEPDVWVRGGV